MADEGNDICGTFERNNAAHELDRNLTKNG